MSRFLDDAVRIFDTAMAAPSGESFADLGILVDACGGLRIVEAAGWNPDSLREHYGARTLYHVTRNQAGVQVNGRAPGHSCTLQSDKPRVPSLHSGVPQYRVVPAAPRTRFW